MKLWDIVKKVGAGIISTAVPGGPLIVGAINEFLPDEKKLPANATGEQAQDALAGLPAETRAALMDKEFDVQITEIKESNETLRQMLVSDAATPHTTRPYIAKHSFHVIGFTIVMVILLWCYGVARENDTIVKTITEGWPFLLAAIGPLVVLLHAYFGVLRQEHKNKLDAAGRGKTQPTGLNGLLSTLMKR